MDFGVALMEPAVSGNKIEFRLELEFLLLISNRVISNRIAIEYTRSQSTFWRLRLNSKIFEKLWNRNQDRFLRSFLIGRKLVEGDYIEYKTPIL